MAEIFSLNLHNPITGYDVDVEDISSYFEECYELEILYSVSGFQQWLRDGYIANGCQKTR